MTKNKWDCTHKKISKIKNIHKYYILKCKCEYYIRLECAEQMAKIWMFGAQSEHFPLDEGAFDVVVFQHHVLLQTLDGIVVLCVLQLGQEYL